MELVFCQVHQMMEARSENLKEPRRRVALVEVAVLLPDELTDEDARAQAEAYIVSLIGRPDPRKMVQAIEATETAAVVVK